MPRVLLLPNQIREAWIACASTRGDGGERLLYGLAAGNIRKPEGFRGSNYSRFALKRRLMDLPEQVNVLSRD